MVSSDRPLRNIRLIIIVLAVLSLTFKPSSAQDSTVVISYDEVYGLTWSGDSSSFMFEDLENSWQQYHLQTAEITTTNDWPLAPIVTQQQQKVFEFSSGWSKGDGNPMTFASPDGRYIVYPVDSRKCIPIPSEACAYAWVGIADLKTGKHLVTDVPYAAELTIQWSRNSSAFVIADNLRIAPRIHYFSHLYGLPDHIFERDVNANNDNEATIDYKGRIFGVDNVINISNSGNEILLESFNVLFLYRPINNTYTIINNISTVGGMIYTKNSKIEVFVVNQTFQNGVGVLTTAVFDMSATEPKVIATNLMPINIDPNFYIDPFYTYPSPDHKHMIFEARDSSGSNIMYLFTLPPLP